MGDSVVDALVPKGGGTARGGRVGGPAAWWVFLRSVWRGVHPGGDFLLLAALLIGPLGVFWGCLAAGVVVGALWELVD